MRDLRFVSHCPGPRRAAPAPFLHLVAVLSAVLAAGKGVRGVAVLKREARRRRGSLAGALRRASWSLRRAMLLLSVLLSVPLLLLLLLLLLRWRWRP